MDEAELHLRMERVRRRNVAGLSPRRPDAPRVPGVTRRARKTAPDHLHSVLVTIVTPALDEEDELPCRARELAQQEPPWEWIVADGGSGDGTVEVARRLGAIVVRARRGRGSQLNAGASRASGEALRWASLLALYGVGVPPRKLASLYPPVRARRTPRP
jgi:hypothetical protein